MISHAFPPTGGSGVQRTAKFAKYLPEFGWLPLVWASEAAHGLPVDESLLADLPSQVQVIRHRAAPRACQTRPALRGMTNARNIGGLGHVAGRFATAIDWRRRARQAANAFPDDCIRWARESFDPLAQLIDRESIDALYSTYSPVSNHTLAMELKRATGLPWVADFRDLWTDDPRYREPSARRREAARRLERQLLDAADAVVAASPRQRNILAGRIPGMDAKFWTITNGFDIADFADVANSGTKRRETFMMAHVGRLDVARTRPPLFEALSVVHKRREGGGRQFVLRVVGHCNAGTRARLEATGVSIEWRGYVSHAEAIREMAAADALLALLPEGRNADSIICGKLFEYLAAGRPTLVIGPKGGECERIIRQCRAGIAVGFDARAIVWGIKSLMKADAQRRYTVAHDDVRVLPFSRLETTRRLATLLDRLVAPRLQPASKEAPWLTSVS